MCEHFGGYRTINRIPLPLLCYTLIDACAKVTNCNCKFIDYKSLQNHTYYNI